MNERPHQLLSVRVGDDPAAWGAAGFSVVADRTRIADTTIDLVGEQNGRGILDIAVDGIEDAIDGMPFWGTAPPAPEPLAHANRVTGFDHLVAMSPDMDRTTAALESVGLEHRRTRTFEMGGATRRQAFFWLGSVILELAGDDDAHGPDPASLWGLALTCVDLDSAADHLGDALGTVKPAVQSGRSIATLRTRNLGISVPIALMSPHSPS